jgi:hypothetical protein
MTRYHPGRMGLRILKGERVEDIPAILRARRTICSIIAKWSVS